MSIEFETEVKEDHLLVRMEGTFQYDSFLELFKEAYQIAERENRRKILVDLMGLDGTMTTLERYKLGESIAGISIKHTNIIATAVVGNEPLIDPNKFGETVGVNRGARGKVFTDYGEAVNWLAQLTS